VVEATAKETRHDSRQDRALAANGHISEAMKEAAHELGLAGNEVAHGDLVDKPISAVEARGASSWTRYLSASTRNPQAERVRASREAWRITAQAVG
jgi:hypothetical protein